MYLAFPPSFFFNICFVSYHSMLNIIGQNFSLSIHKFIVPSKRRQTYTKQLNTYRYFYKKKKSTTKFYVIFAFESDSIKQV